MSKNNRSNVLLVEILIAVLFFMLSATVLVRVFVTARNMTVRAGVETRALSEAQSVADILHEAGDVDEKLEEMAFIGAHGVWTKSYGDYTIYVQGESQPAGAGTLWQGTVRAFYSMRNVDVARQEDEELFALPCAHYREVQP